MKRWGTITLVLVGFVAGIAFVYSCGGSSGGSNAIAHASDPADIQSIYAFANLASISNSVDWLTLGPSENFIVTDIASGYPICLRAKGGDWRFCATAGISDNTYNFSSGIRFYPNETIQIYFEGNTGIYIYNLSGYSF
jgi:hypothetical protein